MYSYLLIRCSVMTYSSGESALEPPAASAFAGFFSGSATGMLAGLRPGHLALITGVSTIFSGVMGMEEQEALREENERVRKQGVF